MLQEELRMHHTFYKSSSISMSRFRSNAQSTNWEKRTLKKVLWAFINLFWLFNPTWSPSSPTIPSNSAFQSCIGPTHLIQYSWKRYYKLWILNKSRFNPYRVSQSEQQNFDTSFLKKVNCTAQRTNILEQSSKNNSYVCITFSMVLRTLRDVNSCLDIRLSWVLSSLWIIKCRLCLFYVSLTSPFKGLVKFEELA